MIKDVIEYRIRYTDKNGTTFTYHVWRLKDALNISEEIKRRGYKPERTKIKVNHLEHRKLTYYNF